MWAQRVKAALEAQADDRMDLQDLRALLEEAEEQRFPGEGRWLVVLWLVVLWLVED